MSGRWYEDFSQPPGDAALDTPAQQPQNKSKGWAIAIAVVLGVVAILAILFEPTQVVMGTLTGDAFFQSRPTRYWLRALQAGPAEQAEATSQLEKGGKAGVPVLMAILGSRSSSAEVRCNSAEILKKIGPDAVEAGPTMVAALRDGDAHVQAVCASALPAVGVPADTAVPMLTTMLQSAHAVVAARALSTYRGAAAPALPILVEMLQDQSRPTEARWNAARTIGKIGPAAVNTVPVLIGQMEDKESTIREHCAEAIGDIGPSAAPLGLPVLITALTDPNMRVRRDAVRSLGYLGEAAQPAVAEVKKLLKDKEAMVKEAARDALKAIAPEEATPAVKSEPEAAAKTPDKAVNDPK